MARSGAMPFRETGAFTEATTAGYTLMALVPAKLSLLPAIAGIAVGLLLPQHVVAADPAPFEPLYRQAYAQRLSQLGAVHPKTVRSLIRLGSLLVKQGRATDALPLLRLALAVSEETGEGVATTSNELATALDALGQDREAEDLYLRSVELGGSSPRNASILLRVAALRATRGDHAAALAACRDALAEFEEHERELGEAGRRAYADALNRYGMLLESAGEASAEAVYRRALAAYSQEFGAKHPATAAAQANLAGVLALKGDVAAAAELFEMALRTLEAAYDPLARETARVRNRLGEVYETQGRVAEAEAAYREALSAWPEPGAERGLVLANLGRLLGVRGALDAAERTLREAVAALEPHDDSLMAELAEVLDSLGSVLREQSRLGESASTLRRALALREAALGPDHEDTALTLVGLAGTLHLSGELQSARPLYRRALRIQEESLGPAHPEVGETLYNLAHLSLALGEVPSAKAELARSLGILSAAYGSDDAFVAEIRAALRNLERGFSAEGVH